MNVARAAIAYRGSRAAAGNARGQQPQGLAQVHLHRQGRAQFRCRPQQSRQALKGLRGQGVEPLDRRARGKNADEQQPGIGLIARRRQHSGENAAADFREQTRLRRQPGVRQQRHGMHLAQQLQPGLPEALRKRGVQVHQLQPACEPRGDLLITDSGHDEGKEADRPPRSRR